MIVLDASAAVELLLVTPRSVALQEAILAGSTFHAPHVIDIEILHALRRLVRLREISPARAQEALEDLGALNATRYSHEAFCGRIWELRAFLTAYDAAYVALAELLGAPLYTADRRLGRSRGHGARIQVL